MTKRGGLGSLADLAKILEAASDPNSELREDRKETKPAETRERRKSGTSKPRPVDPKRKAWYEKRLREQAAKTAAEVDEQKAEIETEAGVPAQAVTRTAVSALGTNILDTLAAAQSPKEKADKGAKRPEAWRRKPGDPIF